MFFWRKNGNQFSPIKIALAEKGFMDITASTKPPAHCVGLNFSIFSDGQYVLLFVDKWHDQVIEIQVGTYPFNDEKLITLIALAKDIGIEGQFDYRQITSYFDQSKANLILKQSDFIIKILKIMYSSNYHLKLNNS